MKHICIMLCLLLSLVACRGSKATSDSNAVNRSASPSDDYGYSEKNPIMVGGDSEGFGQGAKYEMEYLMRLSGENGEHVYFDRLGSCCGFKTATGSGFLDRYEVFIEGETKPRVLFLNMYKKDTLYAPKGFILK